MKKRMLLSIIVITVTLTGACGLCDSWLSHLIPGTRKPWMPLETGRSWTYFKTVVESDGSIRDYGVSTMEITGKETVVAGRYEDKGVNERLLTYYWDERKYTVISLTDKGALPLTMQLCLDENLLHIRTYTFFDLAADAGDTFVIRENKGSTGGSSDISTCLGEETVIVPAGTFRAKQYVTRNVFYRYGSGDMDEAFRELTSSFWFARGVGIVRMKLSASGSDGNGKTSIYDLKSYDKM